MHGQRALLAVAIGVVSGLAAASVLASCAPRAAIKSSVKRPAPKIAAVVLADPGGAWTPKAAPRRVWVVTLAGQVTTYTMDAQSAEQSALPLSPDGHSLLYAEGGRWPEGDSARLRRLDLDTGRDSIVVDARPVAWGWDTRGRIVAVTGTRDRSGGFGLPPLQDVTILRGEAGRLERDSVDATPVAIDISSFIAADDTAAYLGGSTALGLRGPSKQHVWRYDFSKGRLERIFSHEGMKGGLGSRPGDTGSELALRGISTSPEVLQNGLRMDRLRVDYVTTAGGGFGYQRMLTGVDVLRMTDMRRLKSIPLTPTPTLGTEYYPVFDAGFSRYLKTVSIGPEPRPGSRSGPRNVVEVDVASGRLEPLAPPPSIFASVPLGYLGSSEAFVYRGVDTSRVAVFLKEPGKAPRVILRLGPVPKRGSDMDRPSLLGVQYAK